MNLADKGAVYRWLITDYTQYTHYTLQRQQPLHIKRYTQSSRIALGWKASARPQRRNHVHQITFADEKLNDEDIQGINFLKTLAISVDSSLDRHHSWLSLSLKKKALFTKCQGGITEYPKANWIFFPHKKGWKYSDLLTSIDCLFITFKASALGLPTSILRMIVQFYFPKISSYCEVMGLLILSNLYVGLSPFANIKKLRLR